MLPPINILAACAMLGLGAAAAAAQPPPARPITANVLVYPQFAMLGEAHLFKRNVVLCVQLRNGKAGLWNPISNTIVAGCAAGKNAPSVNGIIAETPANDPSIAGRAGAAGKLTYGIEGGGRCSGPFFRFLQYSSGNKRPNSTARLYFLVVQPSEFTLSQQDCPDYQGKTLHFHANVDSAAALASFELGDGSRLVIARRNGLAVRFIRPLFENTNLGSAYLLAIQNRHDQEVLASQDIPAALALIRTTIATPMPDATHLPTPDFEN